MQKRKRRGGERLIDEAYAQVTNWINQQTAAERQKEEAEEKERVWITHLSTTLIFLTSKVTIDPP